MKYKIKLLEAESKELKRREDSSKSRAVWRKLTAVRMKNQKHSNDTIAKSLSVNRATVGRWIRLFKKEGFEGLVKNNYKPCSSQLTEKQWEEIKIAYLSGEIRESWVLMQYIKVNYGLTFNQRYINRRAREKIGICFRSKKPTVQKMVALMNDHDILKLVDEYASFHNRCPFDMVKYVLDNQDLSHTSELSTDYF